MLFYLTGDIQTGKTRWLQALVAQLEAAGVPVAGVLAPGVWRETPEGPSEREKLGIDNLLLPQHELISFGKRADLAAKEGLLDGENGESGASQSAKAKLGWIFPDSALDTVNAHLAAIGRGSTDAGQAACGESDPHRTILASEESHVPPGLLVIDELGQLELLRGGGLVEAMKLIERGPTARYPHVIVIVREWLLEPAHERFDALWDGAVEELFPDNCSTNKIISLYK